MELFFFILQDGNIATEVKVIGIVGIGDTCLMAESDFTPYLDQTMQVLISAAQMSLNPIDN